MTTMLVPALGRAAPVLSVLADELPARAAGGARAGAGADAVDVLGYRGGEAGGGVEAAGGGVGLGDGVLVEGRGGDGMW